MTDKLDLVLADLAAESEQLDGWVSALAPDGWRTVTTPEGWTVAHQVAHLMWTDETSATAVTDAEAFASGLQEAAKDPAGFVDAKTERLSALEPAELLERWRASRADLAAALRGVPPGEKVPWFGPPMTPASMATARIMETWAHGRDVAEALCIEAPRDARAKHVCHIGVRTRGFAYLVRGKEAPVEDVRVELAGPDGERWTWGSEDAAAKVTGDGYDFALLATRRRHRDDVDVHAHGDAAEEWLDIVQAFAGLPGKDPLRLSER